MADNGEGGGGNDSSAIAEIRKQVLTLVTRNFEGAIEKPIDDVVSRVLSKRRKKWRKRHCLSKVSSRPADPALRDEKELLTGRYYQTGERLLACRRDGYALVRQLEKDKRRLQLQVAESLHQKSSQHLLEPRRSAPSSTSTHETSCILKDLERALSQVDALAKVKEMKLTMTPRLPPLHRRESQERHIPNNEQFGMSLLVPPQEMTQSPGQEHETSDVTSANYGSDNPVASTADAATRTTEQQEPTYDTGAMSNHHSTAGGVEEHLGLDPAVELFPINRGHHNDIEEEVVGEGERECQYSDDLPKLACIMSLMEGQDTASVVEVMADNDIIIETNSSMSSDKVEVPQLEGSFDEERLMLHNTDVLPEKEEIVSTTPENIQEVVMEDEISDTNHTPASPDHLKDTDHHQTAEEELVEMIMKDSELAAWIAKARLRPRTPISYKQTRKKRKSQSRNSSLHN